MSGSIPGQAGSLASTTEVLAASIAAAVERQLTQYVSTMAQQVEAARKTAEQTKVELQAELQAQMAAIGQRLDHQQQAVEAHQAALQGTFQQRLDDMERRQHARLSEVENRLIELPALAGDGGIDPVELANLRDQMDSQSAAAHARIDELHKATRRFDEQAAALVQHVNDTTIALAQRMDEGNQALATAVEERLGVVRATLEAVGPEVQRQLTEQATHVAQRLDFTEHKVTDRMLAMEDRINEQNGVRIANLEATIGRIGAGFDDSIGAMSHRLLELENGVGESLDRLARLEEQVSRVDENAINAVKEQLSTAVGEAMLVRIEIDRLAGTTEEKLDKANLRMAEIEAMLADEMDVSAAVQLERLEELERAITALDPDQFVRKTDPMAAPPGSAPLTGISLPSASLPAPSPTDTSTAEPSLSSF